MQTQVCHACHISHSLLFSLSLTFSPTWTFSYWLLILCEDPAPPPPFKKKQSFGIPVKGHHECTNTHDTHFTQCKHLEIPHVTFSLFSRCSVCGYVCKLVCTFPIWVQRILSTDWASKKLSTVKGWYWNASFYTLCLLILVFLNAILNALLDDDKESQLTVAVKLRKLLSVALCRGGEQTFCYF